jgi:hypothetical protein
MGRASETGSSANRRLNRSPGRISRLADRDDLYRGQHREKGRDCGDERPVPLPERVEEGDADGRWRDKPAAPCNIPAEVAAVADGSRSFSLRP